MALIRHGLDDLDQIFFFASCLPLSAFFRATCDVQNLSIPQKRQFYWRWPSYITGLWFVDFGPPCCSPLDDARWNSIHGGPENHIPWYTDTKNLGSSAIGCYDVGKSPQMCLAGQLHYLTLDTSYPKPQVSIGKPHISTSWPVLCEHARFFTSGWKLSPKDKVRSRANWTLVAMQIVVCVCLKIDRRFYNGKLQKQSCTNFRFVDHPVRTCNVEV